MSKKIIKFIAVLISGLASLLILSFFGTYLWLSQGERDANSIKPYIEEVLTKNLGGTPVKIENITLGVNSSSKAIALKGSSINIGDPTQKNTIQLPQINLEVSLADLLVGKVGLGDIALENLVVTISKHEDGKFYILIGESVKPDDPGIAMENIGFGKNLQGGSNLYIKSMQLSGGKVLYYDLANKLEAIAKDLSIQISHDNKGGIAAIANANITTREKTGELKFNLTVDKGAMSYQGALEFSNINAEFMKGFPEPANKLAGFALPLSGNIGIEGEHSDAIKKIRFDIIGGEGIIILENIFEGKTPVHSFKVSGYASNSFKNIELNSFEVALDKGNLKGSSFITEKRTGHFIELNAELEAMPVNLIKTYWPVILYPHIRDWVTGNISDGMVHKAFVNLHLDPDEQNPKIEWPKPDDVKSEVNFDGAKLTYLEGFPKVQDITGTAKFSGKAMDIQARSGKALSNTNINSARVEIRNFHDPVAHRMFVSVDAKSNLPDVFTFIKIPVFKIEEGLGLNPANATGDVNGKIDLDFLLTPTGAKQNPYDLNYKISGYGKNVAIRDLVKHFDISSGNLETLIDNNGINITGTSNVNGVPLEVKIEKPLDTRTPHLYKVTAKTTADKPTIKDLGIPGLELIRGKPDFELSYTGTPTSNEIELSSNLKDVEINHKDFGLIKPAQEEASLKLQGNIKDNLINFSSFNLSGASVAITGSFTIDSNKSSLKEAKLDKVKFGKNDCKVFSSKDQDGISKIEVTGKSFDISPFITKKNPEPERQKIIISVGEAYSVHETKASPFSMQTDCEGLTCKYMDFRGNTVSGEPFTATIKHEQGIKKLSATADNAGDFLRLMNYYPSIKGGVLRITGSYTEAGKAEQLEGRMIITGFAVANAPVLAKLLSIASLTGILDGLNTTGISFTKLDVPFTKTGSTTIVKDGKCAGPSVGLTAEGAIDQETETMNLKGTLVPAYALNTMLGNVPLIGEVLTGGKGKGIFAFNFSSTGKFENPEISVNPLSVITPGFLRDLFGVFDSKNYQNGETAPPPEPQSGTVVSPKP